MGKLIQLIDPDVRQKLTVDDITFEIRAVNGILKSDLTMAFSTDSEGNLSAPASKMLPIMAKIIIRFEDWPDKTSREVLEGLPDGVMVANIFSTVINAVMLSEDESKNSDSSSGSHSMTSTRNVVDVPDKKEDASETKVVLK